VTQPPSDRSLDCTSFEDRIHRILDDRLTLTGDELLIRHASECASCAQVLNDYDSIDDSVKLLPDEIDKILNDAKEFDVTNGMGSFASRHFGLIASLAALVVIGIGLFNIMNSDQTEFTPRVASNPSSTYGSTRMLPIVKNSITKTSRKTPDSSPFSRNFKLPNTIPSINLPTVPNWDEVYQTLDPLEPVLTYSPELPGIRPMQCSLNATLQLLKQSFSKSEQKTEPDLGFSIDSQFLAAA